MSGQLIINSNNKNGSWLDHPSKKKATNFNHNNKSNYVHQTCESHSNNDMQRHSNTYVAGALNNNFRLEINNLIRKYAIIVLRH